MHFYFEHSVHLTHGSPPHALQEKEVAFVRAVYCNWWNAMRHQVMHPHPPAQAGPAPRPGPAAPSPGPEPLPPPPPAQQDPPSAVVGVLPRKGHVGGF